ncbi:MAG: tRNA dihydrouridine(20/20a) synthase DusA [Chromatiales bacterium 21-64-14]|nr:MAG: tRNA dihydrouridine(20/20a) synthase DusA [Chromatiales bacterium 21-64-14]HQU15411.1 tRNA dihydrouridine(20/20a) synthase DusA [Gammaproteobacteria bacterium]
MNQPCSKTRLSRRLAVAPMMDWTDRHYRYLARLISSRVLLYTEMITTGALLHGMPERLLRYDPAEHPVAVQLGGSEPGDLARCARLAAAAGFDEINLNVGCPSNRVQSGRFGACLMAEPERVADCVAAMGDAVDLPVTVKTRIGIDYRDSYEALAGFITRVADAGCSTFVVHGRKAWLHGLSPKQNREIPPLRYDVVYRLKTDFPMLEIVLNGGVRSLEDAAAHLQRVDGVMIGREAYHNPYFLAAVDQRFYHDCRPMPGRMEVVERYLLYVRRELAAGTALRPLVHPLLGMFQGVPGARVWRRRLSAGLQRPGAGAELILDAALELSVRDEIACSAVASG